MRMPPRSIPALIVLAGALPVALVVSMAAHGREPAAAGTADAVARPRRRRTRPGAHRPALDRRPAHAVGRAAAPARALRHRGAGARLDVTGRRRAAAGADDPRASTASPCSPSTATSVSSTASPRRSTREPSRCSSRCPTSSACIPVRAAFPASVSDKLLESKSFGPDSGHRPSAGVPGYDGRGVTVALLDTGVDLAHPYLRGKVLPGFDIVDGNDEAGAVRNPQDTARDRAARHRARRARRRCRRPRRPARASPPARRSCRFASPGWQPTADGRLLVYARTDQLIAGLERAVDPNGDGDAHDAVRVALVGVAEPYAAFTDGPEARAAQGALDDRDARRRAGRQRRCRRPGVRLGRRPGGRRRGARGRRHRCPRRDAERPGRPAPGARRDPRPAAAAGRRRRAVALASTCVSSRRSGLGSRRSTSSTAKGFSLVAGRAVVVPVGSRSAGHGRCRRAGRGRGRRARRQLAAAGRARGRRGRRRRRSSPCRLRRRPSCWPRRRAGLDVGVSIGPVGNDRNVERGHVAGFSSQGLAFDGSVKPDLVAPGVSLATAEPGTAPDGSPLYGTINGTSASAATVAGAAALLAQMRPSVDAAGAAQPARRVRAAGPSLAVRGRRRHAPARRERGR